MMGLLAVFGTWAPWSPGRPPFPRQPNRETNMSNPTEPTTNPEDATLDDVDRLMDLQDSVKETYAEIGRLRKKVNATVHRRERNRQELEPSGAPRREPRQF